MFPRKELYRRLKLNPALFDIPKPQKVQYPLIREYTLESIKDP